MKHHHLHTILLLSILALIFSCKPKRPAGIISESKMEDVLYDYHLAQGMADANAAGSNHSSYELFAQYQNALFKKYNISQAIFDSSMNYYSSDLEVLNNIYQRVQKRIDHQSQLWATIASTSQDIYSNLTSVGDTANVWSGFEMFVLKNKPAENFQHWTLNCDSTWLPGDDILWRFNAKILSKSQRPSAYADLVVLYTNDSIRSFHASFSPQDRAEFRVRNNVNWTPKRVSGHLFLPMEDDPEKMCYYIISKIDLFRLHKTK